MERVWRIMWSCRTCDFSPRREARDRRTFSCGVQPGKPESQFMIIAL